MTHEFWFKPKTYGYGATPTTWEGWAVVALYIAVIVVCVVAMIVRKESLTVHVSAIATIIAATVLLTAVSLQKTNGAWGWNAGAKHIAGKND